MTAMHRIAAYWAPERAEPLLSGHAAPRPATQRCARYGFHATLKAPRALREGLRANAFIDRLGELAARTPSFEMPVLTPQVWRDFVALRPAQALHAHHPLRRLADACVRALEPLCAPLTAAQSQSREQPADWDARHQAHLRRWGYPYVLDRWEFHLTLSDPLRAAEGMSRALDARLAEAQQHFRDVLTTPRRCRSVSVFVEPVAGAPFTLAQRVPLGR